MLTNNWIGNLPPHEILHWLHHPSEIVKVCFSLDGCQIELETPFASWMSC